MRVVNSLYSLSIGLSPRSRASWPMSCNTSIGSIRPFMAAMIVFTLALSLPAAKRAESIRALSAHMGPTHVQPGCIRCYLSQDLRDPGRVFLVEEWESQGSLDASLRSDHFRGVLATIEESHEPPRIQFDTIATRSGIEVVAAALGRSI